MTTLIAAYNSSGCIGRCDAKCYTATYPECDCICGGANHGVGLKKAQENTNALAEQWMKNYGIEHPDATFEIEANKPVQLELFGDVA